MPEGVEVRLLAEGIAEAIVGASLISFRVLSGRYIKEPICKKQVGKKLPAEVVEVGVKGKLMWWRFDPPMYMLSTLGMTGAWTMRNTKYNRVEFTFARSRNAEKKELYLFDIRNFATLKFVTGDEFQKRIAKLGTDMFSRAWSINDFTTRLKSSRGNIAEVLLGQRVVSGPGAYIIAESLYRAGIAPNRAADGLTPSEIENLYHGVRAVVRESYLANKHAISIRNLEDDIKNINKYKFRIYNRDKDAKGNPVKSFKVGNRSIKWVPAVQK